MTNTPRCDAFFLGYVPIEDAKKFAQLLETELNKANQDLEDGFMPGAYARLGELQRKEMQLYECSNCLAFLVEEFKNSHVKQDNPQMWARCEKAAKQ